MNIPQLFTGTLGATTRRLSAGGLNIPFTCNLTSADATRAISISTNNGVSFYTPTTTLTDAGQMVLAVTYPVTDIKFTGLSADVYTVLG